MGPSPQAPFQPGNLPNEGSVPSPLGEASAFRKTLALRLTPIIESNIRSQPWSHSAISLAGSSVGTIATSNNSALWETGSVASTEHTSVWGDKAPQPTVPSPYESLRIRIADVGASHKAEYQSERGACLPGTRVEALRNIHNWGSKKEQDHPICWLSGAAGVGKSAIAITAAQECEAEGTLVSSFFRADTKRNTPSALWLTIADGLATTIPAMRNVIEGKISEDPKILESVLENQFRELIFMPALIANQRQATPGALPVPNVVVIDGLNECGGEETQLRILYIIQSAYQQAPQFSLRFLICSRPESWIREAFAAEPLVLLSERIVLDDSLAARGDIRCYYLHHFREIVDSQKYAQVEFPSPWPSEEDLDILVERSNGQFAYAVTAIKFIRLAFRHPIEQLRIILNNTPPRRLGTSPYLQLDVLYDIVLSTNPEREEVSSLLAAILILPGYLEPTPAHLELLLGLSSGQVALTLRGMYSVLNIDDWEDTISLYHPSFRDYLVDQTRSRHFYIDLDIQKYVIARRWLRGLTTSKIQTYSPNRIWGKETKSFFTEWIGLCTSIPRPTRDLLDDLRKVELASTFLLSQQPSWKGVFRGLVPWVRSYHGPGKGDVDAHSREADEEWTTLVNCLVHKFQNHPECFHLECPPDVSPRNDVVHWVVGRATGCRLNTRLDGSSPTSVDDVRLVDCSCDLYGGNESYDPGHLAYQESCLQLVKAFISLFTELAQHESVPRLVWLQSGAENLENIMELTGIFGNVTNSLLLKHCRLDMKLPSLGQTFLELAKGRLAMQASDGWEGRKNLFEWIETFPDDFAEEGKAMRAQVSALPWEQWALDWDHHFRMGLGGGGHLRGNRKGKGKATT
ncbi:hypothetical protein PM082_015728 [Marasmius tenuissimus]|nr:hypothetical protein PM082_015728 [Marasmius tenuissimus]